MTTLTADLEREAAPVVQPRTLVAVLALRARQRQDELAPPDPYLVKVEPLAEALCMFLDDWNVNHPQIAGQWGLDPDAPIPLRGTEWVADEAGVDEDLVRAIRRRTVVVIELGVFDRLCAAIDCPQLNHDPRAAVIRNPRVPQAAAA